MRGTVSPRLKNTLGVIGALALAPFALPTMIAIVILIAIAAFILAKWLWLIAVGVLIYLVIMPWVGNNIRRNREVRDERERRARVEHFNDLETCRRDGGGKSE